MIHVLKLSDFRPRCRLSNWQTEGTQENGTRAVAATKSCIRSFSENDSIAGYVQRKKWWQLVASVALLNTALFAHAQNVVSNGYFDTDASSWTTSPEARWSGDANVLVNSNDRGGSLQVQAGSAAEYATQCVPVDPDTTYSFEMYVLRDFNDWPNPVQAAWGYGLELFRGPDCDTSHSEPVGGGFSYGPLHFGWLRFAFPVDTGSRANHILLTLGAAGLEEASKPASFYFDAVTMTRDTIFKSGFEAPLP